MNRAEWLQRWKEEIIESGYYFLLDVEAIQKSLTEKEMTDLTPAESAFIYVSLGKEHWNAQTEARCYWKKRGERRRSIGPFTGKGELTC